LAYVDQVPRAVDVLGPESTRLADTQAGAICRDRHDRRDLAGRQGRLEQALHLRQAEDVRLLVRHLRPRDLLGDRLLPERDAVEELDPGHVHLELLWARPLTHHLAEVVLDVGQPHLPRRPPVVAHELAAAPQVLFPGHLGEVLDR
jgi:hypothetical protein